MIELSKEQYESILKFMDYYCEYTSYEDYKKDNTSCSYLAYIKLTAKQRIKIIISKK